MRPSQWRIRWISPANKQMTSFQMIHLYLLAGNLLLPLLAQPLYFFFICIFVFVFCCCCCCCSCLRFQLINFNKCNTICCVCFKTSDLWICYWCAHSASTKCFVWRFAMEMCGGWERVAKWNRPHSIICVLDFVYSVTQWIYIYI